MNEEQHALLGKPTIMNLAKIGRLRWVGHVARMDEDHPVWMHLTARDRMAALAEERELHGHDGESRYKRT